MGHRTPVGRPRRHKMAGHRRDLTPRHPDRGGTASRSVTTRGCLRRRTCERTTSPGRLLDRRPRRLARIGDHGPRHHRPHHRYHYWLPEPTLFTAFGLPTKTTGREFGEPELEVASR